MEKTRLGLLLSAATLLLSTGASANERRFSFTYESATLPQGERELEMWTTARIKRESFYSQFDNRMEFEVGLSDRLQTSFYLNTTAVRAPDATGELQSQFSFAGVSNEWKYKLMDPVADPIGFALYGELGFGSEEIELEAKLIFDKKVGRNLFALNFVGEQEWEVESANELHPEQKFEVDLAYAFFLTDHWSLGAEVRNTYVVDDGLEFIALFAGPTVSYSQKNWWVTATVMPQLPALKTPEGSSGPYVLNDHERFNARLLFSFFL
ncbi:MAG: hypothetical protein ACJ790_22735 [Myxococcaceae bacterium]